MAPTAGLLGANMAAAGLDPAKVGLVVITHCHQDHIHGLTTRDGTAVFPNAEVAVAEPEWAWWSDAGQREPQPGGPAGELRQCRPPLRPLPRPHPPLRPGRRGLPRHPCRGGLRPYPGPLHLPRRRCRAAADGPGRHHPPAGAVRPPAGDAVAVRIRRAGGRGDPPPGAGRGGDRPRPGHRLPFPVPGGGAHRPGRARGTATSGRIGAEPAAPAASRCRAPAAGHPPCAASLPP